MTTLRRRLLGTARAALGLGLLYYVVVIHGELSRAPELGSRPWGLPFLFTASLIAACLEAWRLSILCRTQRIELRFGGALRLGLVGAFLGYFIPGGTGGDLARMYYLISSSRKRHLEIAAVVLGDRAVGLFSMLLVILLLAPFNKSLLLAHRPLQWLVALSAGVEISMVFAAAVANSRLWESVANRASNVDRALAHWIARSMRVVSESTRHRRHLLAAIGVSILGNLTSLAIFITAGEILVPNTTALTTAFLSPLGMLVNALPITPGGLGLGEAAFEALFRLQDLRGGSAILLTWRVASMPLLIAGGLLYALGKARIETSQTDDFYRPR